MVAIDDDYVKWRYFPLQGWKDGTPRKISAAAMLEVSRHAIDISLRKLRQIMACGQLTKGWNLSFEG